MPRLSEDPFYALRDYTHAKQIFRDNTFQYAPRFKFLFHVYFDIDPNSYFALDLIPGANPGLAVKTIRLPQYTFQTHQMNQYNRKRIVNTKIRYDPINIAFHDDNSNVIRNMWYNYYSYYFDDPNNRDMTQGGATVRNPSQSTQTPINYNFTKRNQYLPESDFNGQSWGYVGEGDINGKKSPFFRNIIIYGFNQKSYVAYTLINPVITSFQHDTYNYGENGGIMENQMSLDYEFVKYDSGSYNGENPSAMVLRFAETGAWDGGPSPNENNYNGKRVGDIQGKNRESISDSGSNGYNSPSGNPYSAGMFTQNNADNSTYKNNPLLNQLTTSNAAAESIIQSALNTVTPQNGRNVLFASAIYGATPQSTANPNINPDSNAIVAPLNAGTSNIG
jgi:hypothetical protein